MFLRLFSAVSAALLCTWAIVANAMVVPDGTMGIPSSFSYTGSADRSAFLRNPATARLVEAVQIFSHGPLRDHDFEHDASRGITYPSTDLKAPSLSELIVIASVDPSRYIGPDGRPTQSDSTESAMDLDLDPDPERKQATIRDLARALLNKSASSSGARAERDEEQDERTGAYKYFQAVLETDLDKEFVATVVQVVSPTLTPSGLVALNLFGTRDFAFVTSPVTNKIQVVDFTTGTTLTISQSTSNPSALVSPEARLPGDDAQQGKPAPTNGKPLLVRVISAIRTIATHPLTFLSLALLITFSVFYRVVRGTSGG